MRHPYKGLPDRQFWKKDSGINDYATFDPISDVPFTIGHSDKVITAGSCFAQHVARYLTASGFNHYIAEPAHPILPESIAEKQNYGVFSARYGNIYTTRQLYQLLMRAYGLFVPETRYWQGTESGTFVDPFRPQVQSGGYISVSELEVDRVQHLAAVRHAIENMDVFVFTLGLTECWVDKRDGAAFPMAPGVAGGAYDPDTVEYRNFATSSVSRDLTLAIEFIQRKNPDIKIILTVSPVPLNATMEPRHVFLSTTWSKAVLRIAAEEACSKFENCCYFPSYEIITSPHVRGRYFAEDCREVTEQGVEHVMGLFFKHFYGVAGQVEQRASDQKKEVLGKDVMKIFQILCDEEAINND